MRNTENAPAGWYPPDPSKPHSTRYWDGLVWTENYHSQETPGGQEDFLATVPTRAPNRSATPRPWYTSWSAIIIGFLLFAVPGVVALWLRRDVSRTAKWIGTAVGALLILPVLTDAGRDGGHSLDDANSGTHSANTSPSEDALWAASFEKGSPAALVDADRARVDTMGEWVMDLLVYDFRDDYTEGRTDEIDRLAALADEYPIKTSPVVEQIRAASSALEAGQAALDQQRYGDAEAQLAAVHASLTPTYDQLLVDLASLEVETGYRFSSDGSFTDSYGTRSAYVERWIDGDTVDTNLGRVRLIGMDTPEMSDQCSEALDAKQLAKSLAPAGTEVTLVDPWSVNDSDKYGRQLRYVELLDGTDIGYTLLLNDLARARYDSRDGYQWHPREKPYRGTGAKPDQQALCTWALAEAFVLIADGDDEGENDRTNLLELTAANLATSSVLVKQVDDARRHHQLDVATGNQGTKVGISDDEFGTDAERPGYTGCRHYAPGGKTWRPIPCP